jgi:hypothetical protein
VGSEDDVLNDEGLYEAVVFSRLRGHGLTEPESATSSPPLPFSDLALGAIDIRQINITYLISET